MESMDQRNQKEELIAQQWLSMIHCNALIQTSQFEYPCQERKVIFCVHIDKREIGVQETVRINGRGNCMYGFFLTFQFSFIRIFFFRNGVAWKFKITTL